MCRLVRCVLVSSLFLLSCVGVCALGEEWDVSGPELVWKLYEPEPYYQALGIVGSGDGGFIMAAYMREAPYSLFEQDVVLLKLDRWGNQVWVKVFEDENTWDPFGCLTEIGDGSLVMAGMSGVDDVYLLRIDSGGSMVWCRTYEWECVPGVNLFRKPFGVVQTGDGGFVVAGRATGARPYPNGTTLGVEGWYLFKTGGDGELLWNRTYLGMEPRAMVPSGDGGFIVLGNIGVGEGEMDACVVKVDKDGEGVWEKIYGHDAPDWARAILRSGDGGYVVIGDDFMLKIGGSGNKVWERPYGGSSMTKTSDGGFIVTSREDTYKIDEEGNKVWEKKHYVEGVWPILGDEWDSVAGIVGTDDHGFVLAGDVWGDVRVQKIDGDGEEVWNRVYGSRMILVDIVSSGDGGYVVAGSRHVEGAGSGAYLVKIDGDGNEVWEMDHWSSGFESAKAIVPSGDGGFVVAGSGLGEGGRDVYVFKVDGEGNKIWEEAYGTPEQDTAADIVLSGDGGFVVAGYTKSLDRDVRHVYLLKVNAWGKKVWERNYELGQRGSVHGIVPTEEGDFIIAGSKYVVGEGTETYLLRIDGSGQMVWERTYKSGTSEYIVKSEDGFVVTSPDGPTFMIDGNGDKIWEKTYVKELSGFFEEEQLAIGGDSIVESCDGGSIIQHTGSIVFWKQVILWRIDGKGEVIWVADLALSNGTSWFRGWFGVQGMALGWNGTFVMAGNIHFPYCREPFVVKFRDLDLVGVCVVPPSECRDLFPELWDKINDMFPVAEKLIKEAKQNGIDTWVMEKEFSDAEYAWERCDLETAEMHLEWIIIIAPEPSILSILGLLLLPALLGRR